MNKGLFSKILPHLIAVVIFLIVAVLYCQPVLQGKVVNQHDILGWKGMAQQSFEYKEKYGHYPLWTNSLFSGMPAYTIAMEAKFTLPTSYLYHLLTLGLPKPISFFLMACICFYFLCMVLRLKPWIGIMAALAYAYATYDPIIISVGHDTKMQAIALAPAVVGSMLLLFQKKYLWGTALFALFFGFQVGTQHLQIVYYTGLLLGIITLVFLIHSWKKEQLASVWASIGLLVAAGVIGFLTFAVTMFPLQEYAKETMRGGKSEMTVATGEQSANKTKGGLDKDYAFSWSYGIPETFTLMVPGIYGGSNGGEEHTGNSQFAQKLSEVGVPEDQGLQMANAYSYWGDQPSTSGPVYLGAVICFLFILGMVYLDTWHKWWIIPATIFGILLAWGKNFAGFNYFLFDYLPFYNKFRAPSMSLFIPQLTFPLTAALALDKLLTSDDKKERLWKTFKTTLFITAGVAGLLVILYFTFSYKGPNDTQIANNFASAMTSQNQSPQMQQQAQYFSQSVMSALREDRQSLFGTDLLRSLLFIGLTALLIAGYIKNKIKALHVMIGVLLLSTIDVLAVGRRYLNANTYVDADQFEATFVPTEADKQIMADASKPFRVFDQSDAQGPFNSSRTSYFHNSIGGYHPAKLGLYQDLIEHQISKGNMEVFNMLNTKYFIVPNPTTGQPQAQQNPNAFGPVWLVKGLKFVPSANEEMNALSHTSLRDTAVVQEKFKSEIKPVNALDTTAQIRLTNYANDTIGYQYSGKNEAFAVFSEVYYPLGWNAYIDGQKAQYVKTDYVLRGMNIPAGKHTITFIFEPETYKLGNTLTLISSLIAIALLVAAMVREIINYKRKKSIAPTTTDSVTV